MSEPVTPSGRFRKKLIEVSMPLTQVSAESIREKSLRHGHPSTLHLWWARRPLAACRAVLFASLVDDPSSCPKEFQTEADQAAERGRLLQLAANIARWENVDERDPGCAGLMDSARLEIAKSLARSRSEDHPTDRYDVLDYLSDPATGITVYDPFSGGGSIPLEAQRLGTRALASDLNPIAVLISKATIEIPVPFRHRPPQNPEARRGGNLGGTDTGATEWLGYAGLADDIRYYGRLVRQKAFEKMGHLYSSVIKEDGTEATVVAWLWANTVECPNPACRAEMPLIKQFKLSNRTNSNRWTTPRYDMERKRFDFEITDHDRDIPLRETVNRRGVTCLACGTFTPLEYVREQARSGGMRQQLKAIAVEGDGGREFVAPTDADERLARGVKAAYRPPGSLPTRALSIRTRAYGWTEWHNLFTERQLNSLCTFGEALDETADEMATDGLDGGYIKAIKTYLALAIGRLAHAGSRLSPWVNSGDFVAGVFGRQAVGMVWDFAESNPFCRFSQNWLAQVNWVAKVVERLPLHSVGGTAFQADATKSDYPGLGPVIATDPPYYDNIGFADISDFFYVWHRRLLREEYPELFAGIQTPKDDELVAGPLFENTKERFEQLMFEVLRRIAANASDEYPSTIFYAYKQKTETVDGVSSTGWETFLNALVNAGLQIVAAWPIRTERPAKLNALQGDMLASSMLIVVRPRPAEAVRVVTRGTFLTELGQQLPGEIERLLGEGIDLTDLDQALIGPGMLIFSRYTRVETVSGDRFGVREALEAINRVVDTYFVGEDGELDPATRFCRNWLDKHDFRPGPHADAEGLALAKDVSIRDLRNDAQLIVTANKQVELIHWSRYGPNDRVDALGGDSTAWESCMRIVYHFNDENGGGLAGAADVVRRIGPEKAGQVERLVRILFNNYDRKQQPSETQRYREIASGWQEIIEAADAAQQGDLPG